MKRLTFLALAALVLASCREDSSPTAPAVEQTSDLVANATARQPVPEHYIVVFRRNLGNVQQLAQALAHKYGGKLKHTYQTALQGMAIELSDAAARALGQDPRVEYLEQDYIVETAQAAGLSHFSMSVEGGPGSPAQSAPGQANPPWGLDRIDQRNLPLNSLYNSGGNGTNVRAYIISTGIRFDHVDFGGRASLGVDVAGSGGVDCHGQGTHMAGVVGGATYGVAKGVRLIAVRVADCTGATTVSQIIQGVDWVTANRVRPAVAAMNFTAHNSQPLINAVNASIAAGVTYAIGGGSWGSLACSSSPANVPNALTVAVSNISDGFVNYASGSCIDMFAPGSDIPSAGIGSTTATNTFSSAAYAAAHVAGAAALILSGNQSALPEHVAIILGRNTTNGVLTSVPSGTPNSLLYTAFLIPNPWTTRAPLLTPRWGLALAPASSRLYAIGGRNGTTRLASMEVYNAGTNAWTSRAPMPAARYDGSGARHIGGLIYVPGGRNSSGALTKTLFAYSIAANTWSTKSPVPVPTGCGGAVTIAGQLYVVTGCGPTAYRGLLHRYTPATDSWTARATAPEAHGYPAVAQIGGKIYVAGGRNAAGTATATLHVYDPASNSWSTKAPMPSPRWRAAGLALNGKLYVVGGFGPVATTFVYDPVTNVWSTKDPMPTPRSDLGFDVIAGLLYAVGGLGSGNATLGVVERYTP